MMTIIIAKEYEERLRLRRYAQGESVAEEFSLQGGAQELFEKAATAALFGGNNTYLLRGALAEDTAEAVIKSAPALIESPHLFLLEEESLTAPVVSELREAGAEVLEGSKGKPAPRPTFTIFALADAMGKRDRKSLWMLLTRALRMGNKPEDIAGVLHWQARSMLAATQAKSASEANMKEFVYSKSKRYGGNFKENELRDLSRNLLILYHEGHRGDDMTLLLERFALTL